MTPPVEKQLVVGVTGSIACYRTCDLVSSLRKEPGLNVRVVMTQEATRFVTPLTFQTLSGNKAYSDLFEVPEEWDLVHTSLSASADLVLVCPATLNLIGKLANGICDDLLSCILFATQAPVMLVPAMNGRMYEHPVTQKNVAELKRLGYEFVGPIQGEMACREIGMGHIADNSTIETAVRRRLKRGGGKGKGHGR